MSVVFPIDCDTGEKRLSFLYRMQELLRLQHNSMGAEYRAGRISASQLRAYYRDTYEPKKDAITEALIIERENVETVSTWNPDLDRDIQ